MKFSRAVGWTIFGRKSGIRNSAEMAAVCARLCEFRSGFLNAQEAVCSSCWRWRTPCNCAIKSTTAGRCQGKSSGKSLPDPGGRVRSQFARATEKLLGTKLHIRLLLQSPPRPLRTELRPTHFRGSGAEAPAEAMRESNGPGGMAGRPSEPVAKTELVP
jgi:hypothetical protein